MELQGTNLALWDYNLFEIGITEISFEIRIMDLKSNLICIFYPHKLAFIWNFYLKLELYDYIGFEIGITGLQDPPPHGALFVAWGSTANCQGKKSSCQG